MEQDKKKALFSWSGGKDSAIALYKIRKDEEYLISALLTTVTAGYDRISMHGVRKGLLKRQADSLGIFLEEIPISKKSSNKEYEAAMRKTLAGYAARGVSSVIFGDIFLEDLKRYREGKLAELGMRGVFPIWKRDTASLAHEFIEFGFRAIVTCVDTEALDRGFAGRIFDEEFLADLPPGADPCGENGEFHSFVFDGPIFKEKIKFEIGKKVLRRKRFYYCDLIDTEQ